MTDADIRRRKARRKVLLHRGLACLFIALAVPAVLWWKSSILFVILLSLATQISTEFGAAEAANDEQLDKRFDCLDAKLDALLERRRRT